ncbi:hypothetical protein SAMN04488056_102285 [Cohaesibacter marisflavi]|uniref:Uncharacterized protein n=1 Tax=Cohaesibacter marisflavi TaxID=655353 RepID=A0A1I5CN20_9HYPH|nr:hypothetical protein SAMN04488056_102285 [Cohaesibacter marisflavi]
MFTRPITPLNTCVGRNVSEEYRDKLAHIFLASHAPTASHFTQLFANSARDFNAAKRTGRRLGLPEQTVGPIQYGIKLFSTNFMPVYPGSNQQDGVALKTSLCESGHTATPRELAPSFTHPYSPSGRMSQETNRHQSNMLSGFPEARRAEQGVNA